MELSHGLHATVCVVQAVVIEKTLFHNQALPSPDIKNKFRYFSISHNRYFIANLM